jgi:hypothetical protein
LANPGRLLRPLLLISPFFPKMANAGPGSLRRARCIPACKLLAQASTAGYNMRFTTKWAGFHRPFFLGVCFCNPDFYEAAFLELNGITRDD